MNCVLCHQPTKFHGRDHGDWVACTWCGLIARDKIPTHAQMNRLYETKPYALEAQLDDERAEYALSMLEQYCRPKRHEADLRLPPLTGVHKVLDVGCGRGVLAKRLLDCGIASEAFGVEVNPKRHDNCLVPVGKSIPKTEGHYSLVVLSHILEHVADPVRLLQDILVCATPTAFVYVEVPTAEMDEHGSISVYITPDHLYAFSERTVTALLRLCGLHILQSKSHVNSGAVGSSGVCSILARRCIPHGDPVVMK